MNLVERLKKDKKGFTLIEMIVVIVILGILLAILVPGMIKYIDKAKDKQVMVNAHAAYMDATTAAAEAYGLPGGTIADAEAAANNLETATGKVTDVTYDKDKGITKMTYTEKASDKFVKIEGGVWKEVGAE